MSLLCSCWARRCLPDSPPQLPAAGTVTNLPADTLTASMPASTPSAPLPSDAAPPPGSIAETLNVGGWQIVVTDGHAVLPEGMTHLPDGAFSGRPSLVSVACPRGLTLIGDGAFLYCPSLSSIAFPAGLISIDSRAFCGCSALTSASFPAGLTSIGMCAFANCSSLSSATFPAALTSIGKHAFEGCSSLASITLPLPDGLSIEDCAFFDCPLDDEAQAAVRAINFWAVQPPIDAQGHATLPEGLTYVGGWAFDGCSSLSSLTFPATLTSIGDCAFHNCSALTSVTFPAGLTSIGQCAFECCSAFTSVTLPAGLTSIGDLSFNGCSSLARVTMPTTATIGFGAFPPATTVLRLPPARMRWYEAVDFILAYKRCRPLLYGWLERANIRLGSYGPDGAARQHDLEEFEADFELGAV